MNEELKPCAHCGSPNIKFKQYTTGGKELFTTVSVACSYCGCCFIARDIECKNLSVEEAKHILTESWNSRAE